MRVRLTKFQRARMRDLMTYDQTATVKQTYAQPWHEYNLSQTSEKLMFLNILDELCQYVSNSRPRKRGHPYLNRREMLYCMALLTYHGKSSRRTISELHIAKDRGLITKVPHFNTILNYFNRKEMKEHLQNLITLSSMPLKYVEQDFAVDSTGFTTSTFARWFDHKWGEDREKRVWRKTHAMCGVKTNTITSIEITKSTSSDTKMFKPLVEKTSKHFTIREVSADMAYTSRTNFELVSQKGGIPYIPFRKNMTGKARRSLIWHRMFRYFTDHHDEYMTHYHKRSNIETTFSMMKRKLGMHLRTKNETAQDNEILTKALCHNIIVLIHEIFELNIDLKFDENFHKIYCAEIRTAQQSQENI